MAKRFCGNGLALVKAAIRSSSFARTAIADTATAAIHAANKPSASNGDPPTDDTNKVQKGSSIIAIASGNTAAVFVKRHRP